MRHRRNKQSRPYPGGTKDQVWFARSYDNQQSQSRMINSRQRKKRVHASVNQSGSRSPNKEKKPLLCGSAGHEKINSSRYPQLSIHTPYRTIRWPIFGEVRILKSNVISLRDPVLIGNKSSGSIESCWSLGQSPLAPANYSSVLRVLCTMNGIWANWVYLHI